MTLDLAAANAKLEAATPEARLAFAVEHFGEGLLFTSSFGAQSGVLLHLWSQVAKHLPVVFIDTGFLFTETIDYRNLISERFGLTIKTLTPDIANAAFRERYGDEIQKTDPDFCCGLNKVAPLASLREAATAWVSGLRRDQSNTRADVAILEQDEHLVRVHPLATMTRADILGYVAAHEIPPHPLTARRYLSIGCEPCTRAVADGETDERAGRWAGSAKTECGLHSARGSAPNPTAPLSDALRPRRVP